MRRLPAVLPVLALLAGCASAAPAPAAAAPATGEPASARPCSAGTAFDSAGRFQWNGTSYAPVGPTTLRNKDTAGLLFAVGCDGAKAYGLIGTRSECELVVLNTDAFDAYAPSPLPAGCPAPVTSSSGHIAALPRSLADCPKVPQQELGAGVSEDMGDAVRVGDSNFVAESPPTTVVTPRDLGPVQFKVRCSYSELNTVTRQQTPELRSHDSTFVPAGNPVYALKGWPPSCRLAAQHDGQWHVYLALDPKAPGIPPKACAATPPTASPVVQVGPWGHCTSTADSLSGGVAADGDYPDYLTHQGRSYSGDALTTVTTADRDAVEFTVGCSFQEFVDHLANEQFQGVAVQGDDEAAALAAGTPVYSVKGHSPLCRLMARTASGWELFTRTEAGCPSPPPLASHPPKT